MLIPAELIHECILDGWTDHIPPATKIHYTNDREGATYSAVPPNLHSFVIILIMKIFANRTRTVVDAETASRLREAQAAAEERDGEKAVEELLKLDPSTLNSKQRRMVKRYKERDEPEQNASAMNVNNNEVPESETKSSCDPVNEETANDSKDSNGKAETEISKEEESGDKDVADKEAIEGKMDENSNDTDTVVESKPFAELLERLNSKQRRKLMRRLEKEGNNVLGEVHQEALRLLEENKPDQASADTSEKKESKGQSENLSSSEKKRKRDWSHLTPEERLRREEQRQKQQEAAERRAKEENNNSKRHPLNSERRRANRRKPKWEHKQLVENEHNTSGYHMRKITK
jgi:hypothetical protein